MAAIAASLNVEAGNGGKRLPSKKKDKVCIFYFRPFLAISSGSAEARLDSFLSSSWWFYSFAVNRGVVSPKLTQTTGGSSVNTIMKSFFQSGLFSNAEHEQTNQTPEAISKTTLGNPGGGGRRFLTVQSRLDQYEHCPVRALDDPAFMPSQLG